MPQWRIDDLLYHVSMTGGRALLVAGSPFEWSEKTAAMARDAAVLLAADGGANHLAGLGLKPMAVIGDLDSINDPTRRWIGEERMVLRPDQNRTDLDKALEYAFDDLGIDRIGVLAALGSRTDHDLGNLGLLARLGMGENLVFEGDDCVALAVRDEAFLPAEVGETWSFWTYDPDVRVTITGVRWPLENAPIDAASKPSVSNEATEKTVHIRAERGSVVVYRNLVPTLSS